MDDPYVAIVHVSKLVLPVLCFRVVMEKMVLRESGAQLENL